MSDTPTPKAVKNELEPMRDTIAVANGLFFEYYPIKLGEKVGGFVQITQLPSVLKEGYVTFERKLFRLTFRDFFRRRLNVNQPSYGTTPAAGATSTATAGPTSTTVVPSGNSDIQPRTRVSDEVSLDEVINLAWDEQISTLLHSLDPEAEWVIEAAPQSGPTDESSTVQVTDTSSESD
jgi:hypothetical protein